MSHRPRTLLLAGAVACLALAGCGGEGLPEAGDTTAVTTAATTDTTATTEAGTGAVTAAATAESLETAVAGHAATHDDEADYLWDAAEIVDIEFDGDSITAGDSSVRVEGTTATVIAAGTYRISGTLSDGRVIVDTGDEAVVRLILNGAAISSTTGAPIAILDAGKAMVVLADGTDNYLTDPAVYSSGGSGEDGPSAPLFSKTDLTVTGGGSLTIDANSNDGIVSTDGLVVSGGHLTIDAVDDGIRGKDYLVVDGADIDVRAGGDGLKSDSSGDAALGYVTIVSGTVTIDSGADAIEAATDVAVAGGTIAISAGGGSRVAVGEASAKGIKGLVGVEIAGGDITIDAADDAVHSNGAVFIEGGSLLLASGDDGVHADATLEIAAASIEITDSYEGLESAVITIDSGDIEIHSSDDGINVAGGSDGSGGQRPPGRGGGPDGFASGDYHLYINGGTILVYAQGDGLDSNGSVEMTGGTAVVHGPTGQNNGALDAGSFDISGGLLIAVGSAGMAEGVDASSSQGAISLMFTSAQAGGTIIHIESSDGLDVLTFEPSKDYQAVTFSSADLVAGASYDVYVGGSASGENLGGLYGASAYTPGTLAGSITASG